LKCKVAIFSKIALYQRQDWKKIIKAEALTNWLSHTVSHSCFSLPPTVLITQCPQWKVIPPLGPLQSSKNTNYPRIKVVWLHHMTIIPASSLWKAYWNKDLEYFRENNKHQRPGYQHLTPNYQEM
jgi:hypothetical protein